MLISYVPAFAYVCVGNVPVISSLVPSPQSTFAFKFVVLLIGNFICVLSAGMFHSVISPCISVISIL